MTPLGALGAASFLLAGMGLFAVLVHVMGLAGGRGLSIAGGLLRGLAAWSDESAPGSAQSPASSPEGIVAVEVERVRGSRRT